MYALYGFVSGFIVSSLVVLVSISFPDLFYSVVPISPIAVSNEFSTNHQLAPLDLKSPDSLGILLMGYGGAGHDGGFLTDAIQVLHIDFKQSKVALVSIPRDLWVRTSNSGEMKINNVIAAAATDKKELIKTGAPALKQVLTDVTGVPIHYFIGVDFVGYQRAIGINFKGIEVDVAETLEDPWYPIKGEELNLCGMSPEKIQEVHAKYSGFELERQFRCRYKQLVFKKGKVTMQGEQALEYVRSRHGSTEGDVSRGKRQQEVLQAIKNRMLSLEVLDDLPGFFTEIAKNTTTDIDVEIVKNLVPFLQSAKDFKITTINLAPTNVFVNSKSANGAFIMVPKEGENKWESVHEYINNEL